MIPMYCLSHREPTLPVQLYDAVIFTKSQPDYETLVGESALPVLARLASNSLMGVCTYRKIVARGDPAPLSAQGPYEICDPALAREQVEPHPGYDFLVHKCRFMSGLNVIQHFNACHGLTDWVDYMNLATEMGILTAERREALEGGTELIEGGATLGVFPGDILRRILAVAHHLNTTFAARYGERIRGYDPLARRIIASLSERLESYWILDELRIRYPLGIPPQIFGRLLCSETGQYKRGTMP